MLYNVLRDVRFIVILATDIAGFYTWFTVGLISLAYLPVKTGHSSLTLANTSSHCVWYEPRGNFTRVHESCCLDVSAFMSTGMDEISRFQELVIYFIYLFFIVFFSLLILTCGLRVAFSYFCMLYIRTFVVTRALMKVILGFAPGWTVSLLLFTRVFTPLLEEKN